MGKEKAIDQLMKLYEDSYQTILKRATKKIASGKYSSRDTALIKDINNQLNSLNRANAKFGKEVIAPLYNAERQKEIAILEKYYEPLKGFNSVHNEAIALMQNSFVDDLATQNRVIGRQLNDFLRTEGIKTSQLLQTGALTKKGAIENFVSKFSDNFLVTYKNGAKVRVDDYARMAINTTIDSSINRAIINTNEEFENDLVQISWHGTSCPLCAVYQGRIYSIGGKSKDYPPLAEVNGGTMEDYGVIHPNCRHRLVSYIAEIDDKEEAHKKFSNEPFEDTRTEYSREKYDKRQEQTRLTRETKKFQSENTVLQALPKSKERDEQIRRNKVKIASRKEKAGKIKQWEIDNTGGKLFTRLPPGVEELN